MRLELSPLSPSALHWAEAEKLYLAAFPEEERREVEDWRHLCLAEPQFTVYEITLDNKFAGLLTVWQFDGFRYVEHFTTTVDVRGKGIGTQALACLIETDASPVVLEVELPNTEIARRRIAFYERNGFTLNSADYQQPPYRPNAQWFPLRLMSTDESYLTTHCPHVISTIHSRVYGV